MRSVRILVDIASADWYFAQGDIVRCDDRNYAAAAALTRGSLAEYVEESREQGGTVAAQHLERERQRQHQQHQKHRRR